MVTSQSRNISPMVVSRSSRLLAGFIGSNSSTPAIGRKTTRVSQGMSATNESLDQEAAQDGQQAEAHAERIVAHHAGLHAPDASAYAARHVAQAVHDAVDNDGVKAPQEARQRQ